MTSGKFNLIFFIYFIKYNKETPLYIVISMKKLKNFISSLIKNQAYSYI